MVMWSWGWTSSGESLAPVFLLFLPPVPPGAIFFLTPLFPVSFASCQSVFTTSANLKSQSLDLIKLPKVGEVALSLSLSPGHMWACHPALIKDSPCSSSNAGCFLGNVCLLWRGQKWAVSKERAMEASSWIRTLPNSVISWSHSSTMFEMC